MPAIVDFDTLPQLFSRLVDHFEGQNYTALAYKNKKTKKWEDISWGGVSE